MMPVSVPKVLCRPPGQKQMEWVDLWEAYVSVVWRAGGGLHMRVILVRAGGRKGVHAWCSLLLGCTHTCMHIAFACLHATATAGAMRCVT